MNKRLFWGISALMLGVSLLSGCGGGGGGGGATNPPPAPVTSASTLTGTGLTVTLAENAATMSVNGTEAYTLSITNSSAAPITVDAALNGSTLVPDATLQIVNAAGVVVYPTRQPLARPRLLPPPPPDGNTVTLQPGQSFSLPLSVAVFTSADTYSATATFAIVQSPSTATQTVTAGPLSVIAQ